jgi:hypothetical protein
MPENDDSWIQRNMDVTRLGSEDGENDSERVWTFQTVSRLE